MTDEFVLFDGQLGTQRVRVWLRAEGGGIALLSHDIGPDVERYFGVEDLETFLVIKAQHLPSLAAALLADQAEADPEAYASVRDAVLHLLAAQYDGNSAATTMLRDRLEGLGIPYDFTMV